MREDPRPNLPCSPPLSLSEETYYFKRYAMAKRVVKQLKVRRGRRTPQESSQLGAAHQALSECRVVLVKANTPLVLKLAKSFARPGALMDDLVGEGLLKLVQCIDMYDIARGYRFCTYLYQSLVFLYLRRRSKERKTWGGRIEEPDEDGWDQALSNYPAQGVDEENADALVELRDVLAKNKAGLTKLEQRVVMLLLEKTQHEVTIITGLSKKRQKELHDTAIEKLKEVLHEL